MQFITTKISYLTLFVLFFSVGSCDQAKKEKSKDLFNTTDKIYSIVPQTTSVFWIGYKTNAKTPVKGQFTKLNIKNAKKGKSVREVLNGLEFSIPIGSLFSNEEVRDTILKSLFFGVMDQTEPLSGKLTITNDTLAKASVKINGVTKDILMTYFIDGQMLSMHGSMDIYDWNAEKALLSLHKACEIKHTGDDGNSKTWNEVGIEVVSYLKVE